MSVTNISNITSDYDLLNLFIEPFEQLKLNATSSEGMKNGFSMDSILDPQADTFLGFWLLGVFGTIIGFMGILGNICSVMVLSHKQMKSSPNFILIALAMSDLMLIVTSVLLFGWTTIYPYSGMMKDYFYKYQPIIATVAYPMGTIAHTISIYMTFLISLERFIAVCHPFRARAFCTHTRTKISILIIISLSILYNIPKFYEIILMQAEDNEYGSFYFVKPSNLRIDKLYIKIYIHWLYFIVMNLIPLSCITFFNLMIYRQVRIVNRMRIKLTSKEMQDIKLTTMLFCVVIVFLACNFLAVLTNILETFYQVHNDPLTKFSNFLVTINSSVNFIIYVVLVRKFRVIFIRQVKSFLHMKDTSNPRDKFCRQLTRYDSEFMSVRRRTETETLTTIDEN